MDKTDDEDETGYPIQRSRSSDEEEEFLFANYFNSKFPILVTSEKRWHPPTDVLETDDEYIVVMDLASVKQQDIKLTHEGGVLTVSGVRKEIDVSQKRHYHKMEIDFGPFERRIKIPARIVDGSIKAVYDNGFLIIKLRKDTTRGSKITHIAIE